MIPDGIDRRTKAGKEEYQAFIDASAGKEILTAEDAEAVKSIVKAFKALGVKTASLDLGSLGRVALW